MITRSLPVAVLLVCGLVWPCSARADALSDARRLAASGQPEQALAATEAGLAAKPRDAELRFLRGVLLADLGRHDGAMDLFRGLNQDYPELPDPLNNLAVLHAARGELEEARLALEMALLNDPTHRTARENLGDIYLRLAIRHWEASAADVRPDSPLARKLNLARQLQAMARPDTRATSRTVP